MGRSTGRDAPLYASACSPLAAGGGSILLVAVLSTSLRIGAGPTRDCKAPSSAGLVLIQSGRGPSDRYRVWSVVGVSGDRAGRRRCPVSRSRSPSRVLATPRAGSLTLTRTGGVGEVVLVGGRPHLSRWHRLPAAPHRGRWVCSAGSSTGDSSGTG